MYGNNSYHWFDAQIQKITSQQNKAKHNETM